MGFYYAHVGYYVGQLHFFHASHSLLALLLAGALVESVGVLPVAAACAELANTVFGLLFILFFVSTLVPLSLCLLAEDGGYEARQHCYLVITPLAVPHLAPCASSARAWRLWAARHSQGEAQPLGAPPPPRGHTRAAFHRRRFHRL